MKSTGTKDIKLQNAMSVRMKFIFVPELEINMSNKNMKRKDDTQREKNKAVQFATHF